MRPVTRPVPPLVALGYGKLVRADRVYALVPLERAERGDRRRTLVYVEGIADPIVASRSEAAIARDVELAIDLERPRTLRQRGPTADQEPLF
jgi:hypothetical protein